MSLVFKLALKLVVIVKSYIIFEKNSCNIYKMLCFSNQAKYSITKTRETENMQLFWGKLPFIKPSKYIYIKHLILLEIFQIINTTSLY